MPEPLLTSVYCPFNLLQLFKDGAHWSKTDFTIMWAFPCSKNMPISVCVYISSPHGVFRVYTIRKCTAYAYCINLWTLATISWRLFAPFRTRKHAASVCLWHAHMNISTGLSDAYTTLSLLSHMFQCCKSWHNISTSSCHWAQWAALRS